MNKEIERKFLVTDERFKQESAGYWIKQGYLSTDPKRTVRVRITDDRAWLTIKSKTEGITRDEFEYPIAIDEAESLLTLCLPGIIEKKRYDIIFDKKLWSVDEFFNDNQGLIIAEIELCHENEPFSKPLWLGDEVSSDARYFNSALIHHPYSQW